MSRTYDATYDALCRPGAVDNFFLLHRPESLDGLAAEMSRLSLLRLRPRADRGPGPGRLRAGRRAFEAGGTEAFLAQDNDRALLVFRGSDDLQAWITNLDARLDGWPGDGRVHVGFRDALAKVWPEVLRRLDDCAGSLIVTGHSQGAALASLAAALLPEAELVTFGSPRVGDQDFAAGLGRARATSTTWTWCATCPSAPCPGWTTTGTAAGCTSSTKTARSRGPTMRSNPGGLEAIFGSLRDNLSHLQQRRLPRYLSDHAPINYVSALA